MGRYMILAAALAVALSPRGSAAQSPDVKVEITPALGGTLFLADLPSSFRLTSEDGQPVVVDRPEMDDALAVGGRAAVRVGSKLGIGGSVLYSPGTLTYTGGESDLGVWLYGVDVSYHARSPEAPARPFVIGGIGGKTYDVEGFDHETDLMWNVGAGVDVALHPRASLRLEARDYMSLFDPELELELDEEVQHDLALTIGLNLSFGPGTRR